MKPLDIKDFKAGHGEQHQGYKSFAPESINREWIISDPQTNTLLEKANRRLGELNAFSLYVPDVDIFILMHIAKEATSSSRIEGTRTNIEDAVLKETDIDPEKRNDWEEVQNYILAINNAVRELEKLPLSSRLLRKTHSILLQGVRGKHKTPGEYRCSQNWIGGATISDAIYIPPHHSEVGQLMGDLENFLHNENISVPNLIRIAIAHYQFETIHPFLDGNGRLGRLLITLYLVSKGLLAKPSLYLSDFFEKNRCHYYDNLNAIRMNNSLLQWIKFFLVAVIETSEKGISTFQAILKLKEDIEGHRMAVFGKRLPNARRFIKMLYSKPRIKPAYVSESLAVSAPTANQLIEDFLRVGILVEQTGFKRNRIFEFKEYLDLFKY